MFKVSGAHLCEYGKVSGAGVRVGGGLCPVWGGTGPFADPRRGDRSLGRVPIRQGGPERISVCGCRKREYLGGEDGSGKSGKDQKTAA